MRRFWAESSSLKGEEFLLKGPLFHHVCHVCRLQKGELFELFLEGKVKYVVALTSIFHSKALARIQKIHPVPPLPQPHFHLALSLPRLNKVDFLLEKACELGVKDFHPFISEMSFFKKASDLPQSRWKRWEKIILQSSAVSERTEALQLHPVCHLQDFSIPSQHRVFMAFEGKEFSKPLKKILKEEKEAKEVWLFVGSEGGFSLEEAQLFSKSNRDVFSFGDQILKLETACLTGLSILKYHYHMKGF